MMEANIFPIQQQQEHPLFGRFNALYGGIIADNCPPLQEFQIAILSKEEFETNPGDLPVIDLDENDAFACSSDRQEEAILSTKAGIIFNQAAIDNLELTEEEQYAAIAHEIGHIIYRFFDKKEQFPKGQGEEIFADSIAAEIGLAEELLSLLEKMVSSGLFQDSVSRFGMRIKYLQCMYINLFTEED